MLLGIMCAERPPDLTGYSSQQPGGPIVPRTGRPGGEGQVRGDDEGPVKFLFHSTTRCGTNGTRARNRLAI
jgi:hypothetical protein